MTTSNINFQTIDWSAIEKTIHREKQDRPPGKPFNSRVKNKTGGIFAGYLADHWCQKGHIVHCIEGEFVSELQSGEGCT
jgi:hypothetical protein